jgi:hypothetical protein
MVLTAQTPSPLDPPKIYSPIGRCIYCGREADRVALSDEHVIPYSLGGTIILPKSSCAKCSGITSSIERHIAKAIWDYTRVQHGLPSYRKERPRHFEMEMPDGSIRNIPIPNMPPVILSFTFPPAGILFGLPPSDEPVSGQIVISNISAEAERRFSEISRQGRVRLNPKGFAASPFARFLAKVAHAYAVAELGMDGFYAALPPIILERDPHFVFHYVGSGGGDEPTSTRLHDLNLRRQWQLAAFSGRGSRELMVVRIRLFARHGLPTHYVVVGEPRGHRSRYPGSGDADKRQSRSSHLGPLKSAGRRSSC